MLNTRHGRKGSQEANCHGAIGASSAFYGQELKKTGVDFRVNADARTSPAHNGNAQLASRLREDLEKCARILAVQCAHYRSKFGELPMSDTLDVLSSEPMNDEQAKWIGDER